MHHDLPVEPARSQQRRIEHVGPIGGSEHDDALAPREAVHLRQDLIERLLAFVVTSDGPPPAARAADRADLVEKEEGGTTLRASAKSSRTRLAPTPTIISM